MFIIPEQVEGIEHGIGAAMAEQFEKEATALTVEGDDLAVDDGTLDAKFVRQGCRESASCAGTESPQYLIG